MRPVSLLLVAVAGLLAAAGPARGQDWGQAKAAKYLDDRQQAWSVYGAAKQSGAAKGTMCISCHTNLTYALARPALSAVEPDAMAAGVSACPAVRAGHRGVGSPIARRVS